MYSSLSKKKKKYLYVWVIMLRLEYDVEYNISFITASPLVAVYYTCYTCVSARSWSAWPYPELWPRSALRTVVDGPPCQTLSLSYLSGPHTFKWTRFVITSSQRNIIEVSCAGRRLKWRTLLTRVWCSAAGHGRRAVSSLCRGGWPSQAAVFAENCFLQRGISGKILGDNDT